MSYLIQEYMLTNIDLTNNIWDIIYIMYWSTAGQRGLKQIILEKIWTLILTSSSAKYSEHKYL